MKIMITAAAVFLILFAAYRIFCATSFDKNLEKAIADGAVILDVRTESEFQTGHIDGAMNISLGTIRGRWMELDTSKTYILCCSLGLRSAKVKSILEEKGFAHILNGGIWTDLEPIVKTNRPQK